MPPASVMAEYVPRDRVVASQDFAGTETVAGGDSTTVGPAVRVLGGGDVLFRADGVIFGDGFSVETGGVLTVETPSRLTCAG